MQGKPGRSLLRPHICGTSVRSNYDLTGRMLLRSAFVQVAESLQVPALVCLLHLIHVEETAFAAWLMEELHV